MCSVHHWVFNDTTHAGNYRNINVKVGDHNYPHPSVLESMMSDLVLVHKEKLEGNIIRGQRNSIEELTDWYSDFETIHPFEDGNGRVGGIIVALFSHKWFSEKRYLVPYQ